MIRPDLTWRDIQHLCVRTATQINPDDPDWSRTAAGRPYSYKYGYGNLDAGLYVEAARNWKLVKPQAWLSMPIIELADADMTPSGHMTGGEFIIAGGITSAMEVTSDQLRKANFDALEHVTVKVWITHARRGDVEVELVSPNGIRSILAAPRKEDMDKNGFAGWQFMTLKHWYVLLVGLGAVLINSTGTRIRWDNGQSASLTKETPNVMAVSLAGA